MTKKYTHGDWISTNVEPADKTQKYYIGVLFNVISGDYEIAFVQYIDGVWYGVPENHEIEKYVPYNPPPIEAVVKHVNDNHQKNN